MSGKKKKKRPNRYLEMKGTQDGRDLQQAFVTKRLKRWARKVPFKRKQCPTCGNMVRWTCEESGLARFAACEPNRSGAILSEGGRILIH